MPIYEYKCTSCCKVHEVIQKFSDPALTVCPDCAGPLEKLISATSFVLKGGGWYKDGYASSSGAGAGKDASSEKPAATTPAAPAAAPSSDKSSSSSDKPSSSS